MKQITIYTKPGCPYCTRAIALFDQKGLSYEEIIASQSPEKREEMLKRAYPKRTYPQIFIGDRHIGGCDDLMILELSGEFDRILSETDE